MARLRADVKKGFLRALWRAAKNNGRTLLQCLDDFQDSIFVFISNGRVVSGTGANGNSTSWEPWSAVRELTQEELFALSEEFYAIRTDTISAMTTAGTDTSIDDAVFDQMLNDDRFQRITQMMGDTTGIRIYGGGGYR